MLERRKARTRNRNLTDECNTSEVAATDDGGHVLRVSDHLGVVVRNDRSGDEVIPIIALSTHRH